MSPLAASLTFAILATLTLACAPGIARQDLALGGMAVVFALALYALSVASLL